jgi:hypothetical protein
VGVREYVQGTALRIFWQAVNAFKEDGLQPMYAVMTANFFQRMLDDIHGGGEEITRQLVMSNSDDPVTYAGVEIILGPLQDVRPLVVCGRVADHLSLFHLNEKQ